MQAHVPKWPVFLVGNLIKIRSDMIVLQTCLDITNIN